MKGRSLFGRRRWIQIDAQNASYVEPNQSASSIYLTLYHGKEVPIAYMFMVAISGALLVAVLALARERRLRLGLQAILNRMLEQWRQHAKTEDGLGRGHRHPRRRRMSGRRKQTTRRNGGKES